MASAEGWGGRPEHRAALAVSAEDGAGAVTRDERLL